MDDHANEPLRHGLLIEGDEEELSETVYKVLEFIDVIGRDEKHFEVDVDEARAFPLDNTPPQYPLVYDHARETRVFEMFCEYYGPNQSDLARADSSMPLYSRDAGPDAASCTQCPSQECLSSGNSREFDPVGEQRFIEVVPVMMYVQGRNDACLPSAAPSASPSSAPLDVDDPTRRVREIRRDNLMRLWALHSIIHEKPDTLVELSPSNRNAPCERGAGRKQKKGHCAFCRKNGEPAAVYEGHCLKNAKGHVVCPILARHKCEVCGATGKDAHTMTHCPYNEDRGKENLPPFRLLANGSISTSHNHK